MNEPEHRVFSGRGDFIDAVYRAFDEVATVGCREIWIADADFADWPLGERAVIDDLTRWAMSHRKLTVLAQTFEDLIRRHPRFVEWRRQWSHVLECRQLDEIEPGQMPTLFLAPGVVTLRLFDRQRMHGSVSRDNADAIRCRELVDEIAQRSVEAFPATTLGL